MKKLESLLKEKRSVIQEDKIYYIGLGNIFGGDDGFGIEAVTRLKTLGFENTFFEYENIDEIVLDLVKNEDRKLVFFFDSADFNKYPGTFSFFEQSEIEDFGNFHKLPVSLYMKLLNDSGNESYLIAVQPGNLGHTHSAMLSGYIKSALDDIVKTIYTVFLKEKVR